MKRLKTALAQFTVTSLTLVLLVCCALFIFSVIETFTEQLLEEQEALPLVQRN
jgi:hypothetical protein